MSTNYYDIETKPLAEAAIAAFDPEEVKTGNLKDPAKIAAKIEEARQQAIERAACDPMTGEVIAIGTWDEDMGRRLYCSYQGWDIGADESGWFSVFDTEANLLRAFWQWVEVQAVPESRFVGWYSSGFDLPYLIKRSWRNGVTPVVLEDIPVSRYSRRWIDAMHHFCLDHQGRCSLERAAKFLDVAQPREHGVEGKDFWKVLNNDPVRAAAYLADDVQELVDICETMGLR